MTQPARAKVAARATGPATAWRSATNTSEPCRLTTSGRPAGRERRHRAAGDDPVAVHHRGADLPRHAGVPRGCRPPAPSGAAAYAAHRSAHVGLERARRSRTRSAPGCGRVAERMEGDAAALAPAASARMPRQHHVDVVAARGHAARNRLHERADGVARRSAGYDVATITTISRHRVSATRPADARRARTSSLGPSRGAPQHRPATACTRIPG